MKIFICIIVCLTLTAVLIIKCLKRHEQSVIEPFTRQFFNQITPTYFFGVDQSQLYGNEYTLIQTIKQVMPFNVNTLLIENSLDRFNKLDQNEIQFTLARSNEIHNLIHHPTTAYGDLKHENLRFVCALHRIPINIVTNVLGLTEFGQLKGSKVTVNVGPRNGNEYHIAMDLLLQYHLSAGEDVSLTYYDTNEVVDHYGTDVQIVFLCRTHPDPTFLKLVNKQVSKLIEIKRYNNGDLYHMTLDEEPFYKNQPYYSKMILDKENMRSYYPNLVVNDWTFDQRLDRPTEIYQSRFYNTMCLKYYLISNQQTPNADVMKLLYTLKINLNIINQLEFIEDAINTSDLADFNLSLPVHQGASDFYTGAGLYTNLQNPNCIYINGRCDPHQLLNHRL
jgi:TRAP-type uncharacterized transport system substrate-binding protein